VDYGINPDMKLGEVWLTSPSFIIDRWVRKGGKNGRSPGFTSSFSLYIMRIRLTGKL
jgi:hypothetical protein